MDVRIAEYMICISEERSISKAAERLFITQSALNQQLQKLEKDLGTQLFIRNRSDWQLTAAGQAYIDAAKEMLLLKKNTYSKIHDITNAEAAHIRIGLIPERGVDMFTSIYPAFHQHFPETILEPIESNVRSMQKQITEGAIDLGLITVGDGQKDNNTYIHMADEEIFLAIPGNHPLAHLGSADICQAPEISLSRFSNDPFVLISQNSTMYDITRKLFEHAGFKPHVLFSTASSLSKYRMVHVGIGCALLPAVFAVPGENIVFFRLDERPRWEITLCHRNGSYVNKAELCFITLCKKYWDSKVLSR